MQYGPVDMVVLASGEPKFDGSLVVELEKQVAAGTIRVLDAMVLFVDEDGTRRSLDIEDLPPAEQAALGFIDRHAGGLFSSEDADELWEGMVPGSAIVALAIENIWAIGLLNAVEQVGAEIAFHWRIPAPVVADAIANAGK